MRPRIGPPRTRVTTPSVPSGARIEVRCDFERLRTMQVYGGGGSLIRVRCPREDLERYFAASGFAAGRGVLSSGGLEPVADSGGRGGHSVFASAFLDALRSNSSIVDGATVFAQLRRSVMTNADPIPEYSEIRLAGHEGGDFLFIRKGVRSSR